MIHSIKDFSDKQIEELRQCPSVTINLSKRVAEIPMMAEGLFLSISKGVPSVPCLEKEPKQYISKTRLEVYPKTINNVNSNNGDKICARCGSLSERFCYGEVTPGKYNWDRFCLTCYPHHF